jgi:hypothetical protein
VCRTVLHLLVRRRIDYNPARVRSRMPLPLAGFAHSVASSTVGRCVAPSENAGASFFALDDSKFLRQPYLRALASQLGASTNTMPVDRIAFPAASTTRSNSDPHPGKVKVCRSYSRACSAVGERRVRNVGLAQFAQSGLSCTPKPRAFRASSIMRKVPRPDFEFHQTGEMCR